VSASERKEVFVFIHGYDVSFSDAARRAAQLSYDLSFRGVPILYSWPSKGELSAYPADEATIEWTTPHLKSFLERIANESRATTIHLIAHSMGNRALTAALSSIAKEHPRVLPMFKQVFLAAPDIDVGVFKQLAATFPLSADHVTLYASSTDKALIASKKFHQGSRAGDSLVPVVITKVDTVDATAVDTGLGHSYYGDNRSILTDIFSVMQRYDSPAKRFGMQPNNPKNPTYWKFRP
jgi:esterase/lipase superfamily enzyme